MKGASLRVVLLTPTQYGADSAAARMPVTNSALVAWQDAETGQAYSPAVTSFQQTCTDPEGTPIDCPDPRVIEEQAPMGELIGRLAHSRFRCLGVASCATP